MKPLLASRFSWSGPNGLPQLGGRILTHGDETQESKDLGAVKSFNPTIETITNNSSGNGYLKVSTSIFQWGPTLAATSPVSTARWARTIKNLWSTSHVVLATSIEPGNRKQPIWTHDDPWTIDDFPTKTGGCIQPPLGAGYVTAESSTNPCPPRAMPSAQEAKVWHLQTGAVFLNQKATKRCRKIGHIGSAGMCMYVYIYIERERDRDINIDIDTRCRCRCRCRCRYTYGLRYIHWDVYIETYTLRYIHIGCKCDNISTHTHTHVCMYIYIYTYIIAYYNWDITAIQSGKTGDMIYNQRLLVGSVAGDFLKPISATSASCRGLTRT